MRYVALLRGINVVTKNVPMARLRELMANLGFENAKTLIASGNAVFDAKGSASVVQKKLEAAIEKEFGFKVDVIVLAMDSIQKIIAKNPFKKVAVDTNTRFYVTFLAKPPAAALKTRMKKYVSPGKEMRVLDVTDETIFSTLQLTAGFKTPDSMKILEKEFGKQVTTRNWNTVVKLARMA